MKTNRLLGILLLFSLLPLAALAQSLVLWNENAAIKRIDLKAKPVVKVTSDKLKVVGDGINLEYKAETVFRLTCEGISASTRSAEAKMPFRIMSMNNATNTDIEEPAVLVFHSDSLIDSYLRAQVDSISYLYSDKGKGDVNSDGSVDVADISAVISEMAGSADFKGRADVNEDGVVDVADISNVIKIMANNARRAKIATNNEADNILRIHLKEEPIDYGLNSVDSVVFTPPTKFFSILTMSEGKKTYLTATLRLQTGGRWEDWSDLQLGFVFSEKLYPQRDENARWIHCGSKPTAGVLEFKVSNKDWGVVGETTYHYQAYAHSAKLGLTIYGSREMFKLKPVTIWKNTYVKVEEDTENEGYYQAQVSAHIFGESDEIINDYPVARYGFYYDYATVKEPKREIPTSLRQEGIITEVGDIEAALHKLEPGTHYCFCAFVEIADAIYYSGPVGFETPGPSAPSVIVTTGKATDVGAASAQASYSVEVKMHDNKTHSGVVGIQYGLTPDLDQLGEDSYFDLETWNPDCVNYFVTFYKMNPETTYYYRAYATIDGKRYYGNIQSFTTKAITVITYDAKDVTETTAHIDGELFNKDAVNEGDYYGFYINTTGNPGPDNSYYASAVFVEGNDGTFWWDITELSPATTYYYRAFITYKGVLYMGEAKSFTTEGNYSVTVTTKEATNVGAASAQASYTVEIKASENQLQDGVIGVQYGETSDLDQLGEDSHCDLDNWSPNSDPNNYVTFTKLDPTTTYYYRAYATINSKRYYGNILSFTTKAITVKTYDAKDITDKTARVNGELSEKDAINRGDYYGFYINTTGNPNPENSQNVSSVFTSSSDGTFSWLLTGLSPATTYYYRAYITYKDILYMGDVKSFTTLKGESGEFEKLCPDDNHPHMIDLGIGVKWSCCNVGASAPEEYGGYYAWGETKEKSEYSWGTYEHCDASSGNTYLWDYYDIGFNISGTQYDAATVNWGSQWRMPTIDEFNALRKCDSQQKNYNGVYGRKFIGPNGNSIFIPAAGCRKEEALKADGSNCVLWLPSLTSSTGKYAHDIIFTVSGSITDIGERCYGFSIRPVSN